MPPVKTFGERIADALVEDGLLSAKQVQELLEQQKKVDDLRRQVLASRLDMRKQMESVLTPEQRKQMRQFGPWWAREEGE